MPTSCLSSTETTSNLSFPQPNPRHPRPGLFLSVIPILINNNSFHQITQPLPPMSCLSCVFSFYCTPHLICHLLSKHIPHPPPLIPKTLPLQPKPSCVFCANHCDFLPVPLHFSQHRTLGNACLLVPPDGLKFSNRSPSHKSRRPALTVTFKIYSQPPLLAHLRPPHLHLHSDTCLRLDPNIYCSERLKSLKAAASKYHRLAGL